MLWFFNVDPKAKTQPTNKEKLERALGYYADKYKVKPDTCIVNPSFDLTDIVIEGVNIISKSFILQNHAWIGVDKDEPKKKEIDLQPRDEIVDEKPDTGVD